MRFVWPAERYDGLTREASILAAALTLCAGFAITLPVVIVYSAIEHGTSDATASAVEIVTYVQPATRVVNHVPATARVHSRPAAPLASTLNEQPLNIDTASVSATPASASPAATPIESAQTPISSAPASTSRAMGPYSAAAGTALRPNTLTQPKAAPPLPLIAWIPPTQAELDSAGRAHSEVAAQSRDDHRPMPIPLGSISMPMPFGGKVLSREQRTRDSLLHADYLLRLARLAERAKAKRDSLLRATLAGTRPNE